MQKDTYVSPHLCEIKSDNFVVVFRFSQKLSVHNEMFSSQIEMNNSEGNNRTQDLKNTSDFSKDSGSENEINYFGSELGKIIFSDKGSYIFALSLLTLTLISTPLNFLVIRHNYR